MLRRDYLKAMSSAAVIVSSGACRHLFAQELDETNVASSTPVPTTLWVGRSGEESFIDYSTAEGWNAISWFLRDVRANQIGVPHGELLQLLSWMQAWLAAYGSHVRFDIHSGLRTRETNNRTENAARNSLHLPDKKNIFRAVDFSTASIPSNYIGQLGRYANQGGVGFYPSAHFTHVDVGQTGRTWIRR
jgi:uncharacterized protein YcbK (DUF882 family)